MIVKFIFSLPIAYHDNDSLNWYERDTKRIKKNITWDSGIWHKTEDGKYIIEIENKNKSVDLWVIDMVRDKTTGRTRITPVGKVDKLTPLDSNLYKYTLVH